MNNIIENRKKVYSNLPKEKLDNSLSNIVLLYNIDPIKYDQLIKTTQEFICKSMSLAYNKEFTWYDSFLEDNDPWIMELPNKTPNGIINPKNETSKEYTAIQNSINEILDDLNLYPNIKKLYYPNIRYKSSYELLEIKNRPYYTGKFHSDAWVGHVGDCQFLFGVLGDIDNNTVEFNEPINVHENYLTKAESFEEGNTRYESFKFLGNLTKQKLAIMDHACLHRTLIKIPSKPRISIDLAVMIDNEYSHIHSQEFTQISYSYLDPNQLHSVGKDKEYSIEESIFDDVKKTTISII